MTRPSRVPRCPRRHHHDEGTGPNPVVAIGSAGSTTLVLQGLLFANLLAWEALGGRIDAWRLRLQTRLQSRDTATMETRHV